MLVLKYKVVTAPAIEQANPERRERADLRQGPSVCAAHLHVPLQTDLWKDCGQVRLPVLNCR